jgi:hypothetical protein
MKFIGNPITHIEIESETDLTILFSDLDIINYIDILIDYSPSIKEHYTMIKEFIIELKGNINLNSIKRIYPLMRQSNKYCLNIKGGLCNPDKNYLPIVNNSVFYRG